MPDGSPVAAGNPFGGDGPLSFHRQRNRLVGDALSRVEQLAPAAQRLASDSIEAFFSAGAGNGPPRYGRETNILASIAPGGIAADMTALVRRINPNNIGGMPGTLMSLSSLAGRLTGIPTQILGSGAFSAMNMVSSILNINTSNILGSIQNIVGGASELLTLSGAGQLASTVQQVGQTATALAQMSPTQLITGAISTLPLSPIQQFALNMSVGAIASGNPAQLLNVATTIGETLVPGATTAINDLGQIAGSITQIASLATNTPFSLASLVQASELTNRISALASNNSILSGIFDISQATDAQRDAFEQIRALAYDAGHVLNVGDRLVNLANNPSLLLSELDRIINNTV
jgi:hypothetical protein